MTDQNEDVINVDIYKDYKCITRNPYGFWDIQNEQGGSVPQKLQGKFTSLVDCHRVIDSYLDAQALLSKSHAVKHMERVKAAKAKEAEVTIET